MTKFLKIIASIFFSVFILVGGLGFYFLHNFDLNQYKPYVTEMVEKKIGRELLINGDASIGISLIPTLIVEDVELSNAPWATKPKMVKIQKLEIKFAILPLLKKQIVIDKVVVQNPEIYMETAQDGKNNWEFSVAKIKNSDTSGKTDTEEESKNIKANPALAMLVGFVAKSVEVTDGIVEIKDLRKNASNIININKVMFSAPSSDEDINVSFNVNVDGKNIKGSAVLGSLNVLLNSENAYPISADVQAYGIDTAITGSVVDVFSHPRYAFNANVYNPAGNLNAPETSLQTLVEGDVKKISADIKSLNIVDNLIVGNLSIDISGQRPIIRTNLKSEKINLLNFSSNSNFAQFELIAEANATELVPQTLIPFSELLKIDASADIKIDKLIINETMNAKNVSLKTNLYNGLLNIEPLQLDFGNGSIIINSKIDANTHNIQISMSSQNLILQQLHKEFLVDGNKDFGFLSGGNTDIEATLYSNGKTYRQLVENMNGQIITIVGESVVQTGALSFLKGNFISQLLSALNLSDKNTDINLVCAVLRTDIKNGIAEFPNGIALQAKEMSLVSSGNVNLKNDDLDFSIQPYSGKIKDFNVAQAISSFIKVKGNIQKPKISIDDKSALKTLAGVAVAGPAYLGGQVLLDANSSPCYTALSGTKYQKRFPAPSKAETAKQDITKQIDNNINNIKDMAKDILKSFK